MIDPARIEAAARAMYEARMAFWGVPECSWARVGSANKDKWMDVAAMVLASAFPELANGTAWLAPMEATDEMLEAARGAWSWPDAWTAMRDAHLKAQGSDA